MIPEARNSRKFGDYFNLVGMWQEFYGVARDPVAMCSRSLKNKVRKYNLATNQPGNDSLIKRLYRKMHDK